MKRKFIVLLTLALCAALLLCGCTPVTEQDPDPEVLQPLPSVDDPLYTGDDIAASPFVGRFVCSYNAMFKSLAKDVFTEGEEGAPWLECRADGTFTLSVVHDMGTGAHRAVSGTFTVSGEVATFTVTDHGGADAASDGQNFTMTLVSANEMRHGGDSIDCVSAGDIFQRDAE